MKDCIFCENVEDVLFESDNFYVKIGKGIVCDGHCMIITKQHLDCIAGIDESLVDEFLFLKNKLTNFITENFYKPFVLENGAVMQSVFHAHMHFIPLKSKYYSEVSLINDMALLFLKKNNISYKKINNFFELKDIYKEDGEYLYLEEGDDTFIVETKKNRNFLEEMKTALSYRHFFSRKFGMKEVEDWRFMTEEDLVLDCLKIQETFNKFKDFSNYYGRL